MNADLRERSCEGCSCTETRACPDGCSWDVAYLRAGRYICSRCAPHIRDEESRP